MIPGFSMCTCIHTLSFSHYQGHSNTTQTHVVTQRVCVLLLMRQAAADRVSSWAGFPGQTTARRLDKHQCKWLCSAVGSPATARPLQPPAQAHPAKVSKCGLTCMRRGSVCKIVAIHVKQKTTEPLRYRAQISGLC